MTRTKHAVDATPGHPRPAPVSRQSRLIDLLRGTALDSSWGAWGLLAAGLIVTVLVSFHIKAGVESAAQRAFDFTCHEIQLNIDARLEAAAQVLLSGTALFDASKTVSREEWRTFTHRLQIQKHLPGIQGIGFALFIPPEQLTQHIQEIRREGFPDYQVKPAGKRETISAIIYLEPFVDRNLRAFGYDMLSEPVRRAAMERARDANTTALSGKVILVQETDQHVQAGALMYVPVYRHGLPIETIEQRRAAIQGWVYSPYRMADLMYGALGNWNGEQNNGKQISLQVYDGDMLSADTLLYDSQSAADRALASTALVTRLIPVVFAGHLWTLRFTQSGGLTSASDYGKFWLVLFGGTIIALLLFGLMCSLTNVRNRAQKLREEVTERKQAEASLRESEERFKQVAENAQEWIWEVDAEGLYRYCSPVVEDILGYTPAELLGQKHFYDFFAPDVKEALTAGALGAFQSKTPFRNLITPNVHKDGRIVILETSGTPMLDARGNLLGYRGTNADITERKRAEEEKSRLEDRLQQARKMESVGRLAGGVAHNFNNVLMGIMGYVELCGDALPPEHTIRAFLDEITGEAKRLADLTRQLLGFARIQTISPRELDLNVAVSAVLEFLRGQNGPEIDTVWNRDPALWPVKLDACQIDQVLTALYSNACDAIGAAGGTGKITVETVNVTLDRADCACHVDAAPGEYALLTVSDNGCGMNKDTVNNLFEPFFTTKDLSTGAGLGLATAYGIVKQNNGFINVYSEPGKGTTFKIYLPRHAREETAPAAAAPAKPPLGTETVLLVEDEKSVRITTQIFLEDLGYTMLVAENPETALRLAAEHPGEIHLLITDVIMPSMSGRDLAQRLLELRPAIKRLFISGFTADVIAQRGILDDGVNFLSKPFGRDVLARKVREVLEEGE